MEKSNYLLNKSTKILGFLLLGFLLIGGVTFLQAPRLTQENEQVNPEIYKQEEQLKKNRLAFIRKLPSFGYNNLIADWLFLDFIQYYGDTSARLVTGNGLVPEYFQQVVQRDPRFVESYLYLAPATSLFAGRPDKTVAIMTEGLKFVDPKQTLSYQLWSYKAIDQLLFLGDIEGAKKSYQMAEKWASQFPDEFSQYVAQSSRDSLKFLGTNPDSRLARASAWAMILGNARDEQTRELAISKIKATGGELTITPTGISVKIPKD